MDYSYILTPALAWLFAGIIKFIINSVVAKRMAFDLIGYGGLPSNHSAIVCSTATVIALKVGVSHPAFGVAITFALIVILDAYSLRRQVGMHAEIINKLTTDMSSHNLLRVRIGHTRLEIVSGVIVGVLVAYAISILMIF